ncbi:hypothetical protein [Kitasatospora acidiphila]|nr:hypothetical protein [Kitasatospora acidiphila]
MFSQFGGLVVGSSVVPRVADVDEIGLDEHEAVVIAGSGGLVF